MSNLTHVFIRPCVALAFIASLSLAFSVAAVAQTKVDKDLADAFDDLPEIIDPGKPVMIAYKVKQDDKWLLRTTTESEIDVMGMMMPKHDQQLLEFTINSVSDDGFQFTSRLKELISEMDTNGGRYRVDSVDPDQQMADPAFQPLVDLWSKILGQSLTSDCNSNGRVLEFQVPQGIKDAARNNAYGILPEDLTSFFLSGLFEMPGREVAVGEKWDIPPVHAPFGVEDATQSAIYLGTAKVGDVELAAVQIEMEIEFEDREGRISDMEMLSKTLVFFDLESGTLWKSFQLIESDMVMMIGGREMNQVTEATSITVKMEDE